MVESTAGIIQLWILNKLALKVMFVGIYFDIIMITANNVLLQFFQYFLDG